MDKQKLEALRNKYLDQQYHDVDDPEYKNALMGAADMFSGIATLLDAPYQESLTDLDIALIGVPFDGGVIHRTGARFGPRAIRDISMSVGPFNHQTRVNPFGLCAIADGVLCFYRTTGSEDRCKHCPDRLDRRRRPDCRDCWRPVCRTSGK